jgi:hypothetical protein
MGIDITKLAENQLLTVLGDGDWHLTLPTGDPDVIATAQWRQDLVEAACCWFVRWVMTGVDIEIIHDYDPPWDGSGSPRRQPADPMMLLIRHDSLDSWMTAEPTGQSRASYLSGMGLFWDTYEDQLQEEIDSRVYHLLRTHWLKLRDYPDDFELSEDPDWEELFSVELHLQQALRLFVGRITTADAWKQYESVVHAQIAEERRQATIRQAEYERKRDLAQQFWRQHFADLTGQRIEYPEFVGLKLGPRIADILADTDPQVVEAIADLGLPGNFSTHASADIKYIARKIANSDAGD